MAWPPLFHGRDRLLKAFPKSQRFQGAEGADLRKCLLNSSSEPGLETRRAGYVVKWKQ
jgi:hypothetical protein